MEDNKLDWSAFTVNMPSHESSEKIKKYWTCQDKFEKWFLKLAEFRSHDGSLRGREEQIQPGDTYRWQWYGWPEAVEENGKILQPKQDEFLRFIFGKAGTVSLRIIDDNGYNVLRLIQEKIPTDEKSRMDFYVGCKTGWTFYMLNLKSIMQDGPDLRNKRSELQMD